MTRAILPWLMPLLVMLAAITVFPPLALGLAKVIGAGRCAPLATGSDRQRPV
jgi:hypothetical protein